MPLDLSGNTLTYSGITSAGVFKYRVNRAGLVLNLDAGDLNSYPGSGTTWYDLSGNGHNFTIPTGATWNSAGYFAVNGTGGFSGPASNATTWGINTNVEHYVETWIKITTVTNNTFLYFEATPSVGADTRAISLHLPYGSNVVYYDVAGCCDPQQRINYTDNTLSGGTITHMGFRTRVNGFPNREIFKNMISQVTSGTYSTGTVTWDKTSAISLCGSAWTGNIYLIRIYNRPLQPYEMVENFQSDRRRFGI